MLSTKHIAEVIGPTIEALGFELIRVHYRAINRPTLQIMAEPLNGREMIVEDCAEISRAVSALLDVEDLISEAYDLEISSPGLDRPLVKPDDYKRFTGFSAKVDLKENLNGRKRFRGCVLGFQDGAVHLKMDNEGKITIPFSDIDRAKLIITNESIAEVLRERDASNMELAQEDVSEKT